MRRLPSREAFPGESFRVHPLLLQPSDQLSAGPALGSLTALPFLETHCEDLVSYIPTRLISITDGRL